MEKYAEQVHRDSGLRGIYLPIIKEVSVSASSENVTVLDTDTDIPSDLKFDGMVLRIRALGYDFETGIQNIKLTVYGEKVVTLNLGTYQIGTYTSPKEFDLPLLGPCGRIIIKCDNTDTVARKISIRLDLQISED